MGKGVKGTTERVNVNATKPDTKTEVKVEVEVEVETEAEPGQEAEEAFAQHRTSA